MNEISIQTNQLLILEGSSQGFEQPKIKKNTHDLILKNKFSAPMLAILQEIDRNLSSPEENAFMSFLAQTELHPNHGYHEDFVKFKKKIEREHTPSLAHKIAYTYFRRHDEYVIVTKKIFQKEEDIFRKAIYFKTEDGLVVAPKALFHFKKHYDDSSFGCLENQLAMMENFPLEEISPKVYGKTLRVIPASKTEDEVRILHLFQEKFGEDMIMSWQLLKKLNFSDQLEIASQLNGLLKKLHEKKITHGDLKLENIVIKQMEGSQFPRHLVKLIDFEFSHLWSSTRDGTFGTTKIVPPETFFEDDFDPFKAEMWCLGIVLYHLFSKKHEDLFEEAANTVDQYSLDQVVELTEEQERALLKKYDKSSEIAFSAELMSSHPHYEEILKIVKALLSLDPAKRPTTEVLENEFKRLSLNCQKD